MVKTLDFAKAQFIYEALQSTSLTDLRDGLFKSAIHYAEIRAKWQFLSVPDRLDSDPARTRAHNTFIDSCNILSRNMAKLGENINWRAELGSDRKVIGDFACYLHCLLGLKAR